MHRPPDAPGGDRPRRRMRFEGVSHEGAPDGHCSLTVRLEWAGRSVEAAARGVETQEGRVRAAAAAALAAARSVVGGASRLDLLGVKAVRAFDGWVVVVRVLSGDPPGGLKLLGAASCEAEDGLERAAAVAVLDATNRVLEGRALP